MKGLDFLDLFHRRRRATSGGGFPSCFSQFIGINNTCFLAVLFSALCLFASPLSSQQITPLDIVNSPYRESFITITPNGECLCFMSLRGEQSWSNGDVWVFDGKKQYDGDIWCSSKINGEWQTPIVLNSTINTSQREDEPSMLVGGQIVIFESWHEKWITQGGPYYRAKLDGTQWQSPSGLGGQIPQFFIDMRKKRDERLFRDIDNAFNADTAALLKILWKNDYKRFRKILADNGIHSQSYREFTEGMAVSPYGDYIVFAANNFESEFFHFDLYYSEYVNGEWTYPTPLSVNTSASELTPFIAGDGRTLFFASDREGGYGGFDMYKTRLVDGAVCDNSVLNIGTPYNSHKDEYGIVVNSLDNEGFIVRDGDIYKIELNDKTKAEKTIVINGQVINYKAEPLAMTVYLKTGDTVLYQTNSNKTTGRFSLAFPWTNGAFEIGIIIIDPVGIWQHFEIDAETANPLFFRIKVPFLPRKGVIIKEEYLCFGADSSVVRTDAYAILQEIVELLKKNSDLVAEVSGHTNSIPPDDYCMRLSYDRAIEVHDYFRVQGIPSTRVDYIGYGKSQPLVSNESRWGREKNQRVEVKIIRLN